MIRHLIRNTSAEKPHVVFNIQSLPAAGKRSWRGIACTADGRTIYATSYSGEPMAKSTDFGETWITIAAPIPYGHGIACSSDGTKLVWGSAGAAAGLFTSDNSGANWTKRDSLRTSGTIGTASSADGTKLMVCEYTGDQALSSLRQSNDAGANWTKIATAPAGAWGAIATSADGSILYANEWRNGGTVYKSIDSGQNWQKLDIQSKWLGIACSANGSLVYLSSELGQIYTSMDGGQTFLLRNTLGKPLSKVACSANGQIAYAVSLTNDYIYRLV